MSCEAQRQKQNQERGQDQEKEQEQDQEKEQEQDQEREQEQDQEKEQDQDSKASGGMKHVSIAVQQGQRRRIMKGMVYQTDEKHGYIYLVRTREFKSLRRPVYKVGKTSQCPDTRITRLHKYTKGSEIYLILQCDVMDVSLIEKDILERFCHRWDPGPDGSEDFIIPTEAELLEAKHIIIEVIMDYARRRLSAVATT